MNTIRLTAILFLLSVFGCTTGGSQASRDVVDRDTIQGDGAALDGIIPDGLDTSDQGSGDVAHPDELWEDTLCGDPTVCDDGQLCTTDLCVPELGCTHEFNVFPCDDDDPCTTNDTCGEGVCKGEAIPDCTSQGCGDGQCLGSETCETCPADCNPLGLGTCGAACDPTRPESVCGDNGICAPVKDGEVFSPAITGGNGVCGFHCTTDEDCQAGTCVKLAGLEVDGICGFPCKSQEDCGAYRTCLMKKGSTEGLCLPATACDPSASDFCTCLAATGLETPGVCGLSCHGGVPTSCAAFGLSCLPYAAAEYHAGLCVFGTPVCTPGGETCGETAYCRPLGGPAFVRYAVFCTPDGPLAEGESCEASIEAGCGHGLFCHAGRCVKVCKPDGSTCPSGSCVDLSSNYKFSPGILSACIDRCGDKFCDPEESCASCPQDCTSCGVGCGDGECQQESETCESCPFDCGSCPFCGDGDCGEGESCDSCPADCKDCPVCGDDTCEEGLETCQTCEADCGKCSTVCGDQDCGPSESCLNCPADCGTCTGECGDSKCSLNERCWTCPKDCGACAWTCGDGTCNDGEDCASCPADCSLLGSSSCSGTCDPAKVASGCTGARVCVPTVSGRLLPDPFSEGNGVCTITCQSDQNCLPGNACLPMEGLDAAGVCGLACNQANPCPEAFTCVPKAGSQTEGVCVQGLPCKVSSGCGNALTVCAQYKGAAADTGVCMPGCWAANPNSCQGGTCVPRTDAVWHNGTCLGADTACDLFTVASCGAGKACVQLGGMALSGSSPVCVKAGTGTSGSACSPASPCGQGLFCFGGYCHAYCKPAVPATCVGAVCADLWLEVNLPEGQLGVCLKH